MYTLPGGSRLEATRIDTCSDGAIQNKKINDLSAEDRKQIALLISTSGYSKEVVTTVINNLMLLENENGRKEFFKDPVVQSILVSGVIDGHITLGLIQQGRTREASPEGSLMERFMAQMNQCEVNIDGRAQDDIIDNKLDVLLSTVKRWPENAFVLRFLGVTSNKSLSEASQMSETSQMKIAQAIFNGDFGRNVSVLVNVVRLMGALSFALPQAKLAQAIREKKLGNAQDVMLGIVRCCKFAEASSQLEFACAFRDKALTFNPNVLMAMAENFGNFTHPVAQRVIASMIYSAAVPGKPSPGWLRPGSPEAPEIKHFSGSPALILKVAENLRAFTDSYARSNIAVAICADVFGKNADVQEALVSCLDMFAIGVDPRNFKDELDKVGGPNPEKLAEKIVEDLAVQIETQRVISDAILLGKLCANEAIQVAVARHLRIFKTDTRVELITNKFNDRGVRTKLDGLNSKPESKLHKAFATLGAAQLYIQKNIVKAMECEMPNAKFAGLAKRHVADNFGIFATTDSFGNAEIAAHVALQPRIADLVVDSYFEDIKDKMGPCLGVFSDKDPRRKVATKIISNSSYSFRYELVQEFIARNISEGLFDPMNNALDLTRAASKFCSNDVNISDSAAAYLQKALEEKRFSDIDEEITKKLENKLAVHQGLMVKSILDGTKAKEELGPIIKSFCDATTIPSAIVNSLQQAVNKGRLASIDPDLRRRFENKLKEYFATEPWSVYLQRNVINPATGLLLFVGAAVVLAEVQYGALTKLQHYGYSQGEEMPPQDN